MSGAHFVMGQVAGTAVALSLRQGVALHGLPLAALQQIRQAKGASLS